jgi:rRNA processing protein Gar1
LKNWVKLNLFYLGKSKKYQIFRAKQWNKALEKIVNKPLFTESYEEIGYIKEVFGPVDLPFISVKPTLNYQFSSQNKCYVKID